MVQIAIRCGPRVPLAADELEGWLELEVDELRKAAPRGTVRLSRLTQGAPTTDLDVGWLVELELDEGEPLLAEHGLAEALRDMRLLGLQMTLLVPRESGANGRAALVRNSPPRRTPGPTRRQPIPMLPFEASGLTLPTLHNSAEANEVAARFGVTPPGVRTRARWTQS